MAPARQFESRRRDASRLQGVQQFHPSPAVGCQRSVRSELFQRGGDQVRDRHGRTPHRKRLATPCAFHVQTPDTIPEPAFGQPGICRYLRDTLQTDTVSADSPKGSNVGGKSIIFCTNITTGQIHGGQSSETFRQRRVVTPDSDPILV